MASVGTVTVDVKVGTDLEAAIRTIVRREVESIAYAAYLKEDCEKYDAQHALFLLADEALRRT